VLLLTTVAGDSQRPRICIPALLLLQIMDRRQRRTKGGRGRVPANDRRRCCFTRWRHWCRRREVVLLLAPATPRRRCSQRRRHQRREALLLRETVTSTVRDGRGAARLLLVMATTEGEGRRRGAGATAAGATAAGAGEAAAAGLGRIGIGHDAPTPGRVGFIDPWIKSGFARGPRVRTTPPVKNGRTRLPDGKIQRLRAANLCEAPYGGHHIQR
jgi:hypothetical protein